MADISAVTAVLFHYSAVEIGTIFSVVSTGLTGISGYNCIYCSTVTSVCFGYRD